MRDRAEGLLRSRLCTGQAERWLVTGRARQAALVRAWCRNIFIGLPLIIVELLFHAPYRKLMIEGDQEALLNRTLATYRHLDVKTPTMCHIFPPHYTQQHSSSCFLLQGPSLYVATLSSCAWPWTERPQSRSQSRMLHSSLIEVNWAFDLGA